MVANMTTYTIIDTDSHLAEPPDLWADRLPKKWADVSPRVIRDERAGFDRWVVGDRRITGVSAFASAGWSEFPPKFPPTQEEAEPAAFDATERLRRMDSDGIYAQCLYPNLLSFTSYAFLAVGSDFATDCVRAYNDYLAGFAAAAPDRFVALCALPFWDVAASVRELHRAHKMGHRGVVFIGKPYKLGLPRLEDKHWEPLLRAVEELDLSLNFHTSFSENTEKDFLGQVGHRMSRAEFVKTSSVALLGLAETLADVLTSDVCIRYPKLKMVMVESGVGWLRYMLETLDWQWVNSGAQKAYPERELPSYYFGRQIYGSFWFERESMSRIADLYQDNLMFETDYPHPTSLSPGPNSSSLSPMKMADVALKNITPSIREKLLFTNAAKLYHVKGPEPLTDPRAPSSH
jgi:predicted TIM-barrel fold metal-dependent hydrolase